MKQKIITIVLSLIAILSPLLIIPDKNNTNYNILKLIVLLSGGFILFIFLLTEYKTIKLDKKDKIILFFLGVVFISTLLSGNIKKSIIGENNRFEGLLMFVTYVCIYLSSKKYFKYEKINVFFNIMFYVSMIIGIVGILQKYINFKELYPIFNKGICSTFGNSNFFGSFICIVLPIAIYFYIFKNSKKGFSLSLIMFFNMISSGTRSSWVAVAFILSVGLIYILIQKNKKYLKNIVILLICFCIIFIYLLNGFSFIINSIKKEEKITIENSNEVVLPEVNNKQSEKLSTTKIKVDLIKEEIQQIQENGFLNKMGSGRIEIWKMTMKLIMKKPIFGCGPDNLLQGLALDCTSELGQYLERTKDVVDKAHNEFLQIAVTIGIPGLISYLLFVGFVLFSKIKLAKNNKVYYVISMTIICYLIQAFFNISTIGVAPLFWMLLGLSDNVEFVNGIEKIYNKNIE